jgi:hypothetical protein
MPVLEEVKAFLKIYLEGKAESTKKQADVALTHWENFTKQKPFKVEPQDVDKFFYVCLKRLNPNSLSAYMFHIGKYLAWSGRKDLEEYIMNIRKKLDAKEIAKSTIDHHDILKMLTKVTELRGKLIIRLLVFSEIPIGCLKNLKVRHIYNEKNYEMPCKGRNISGVFYSDTAEIIKKYISEEKLKKTDGLIGIQERAIQHLIPDYAEKVEIKKKVTPKDLRMFGKDPRKREWLIEVYEKDKMKKPI